MGKRSKAYRYGNREDALFQNAVFCTSSIRFCGVFVSTFPPYTFRQPHGIMQSSGRDNTLRSDQYEIQPDKGILY